VVVLGVQSIDPQIHPDTHGRSYDGNKDGDAEKLAVDYSKVDLIQIRPDTMGGVSMMELMRDGVVAGTSRVVWLSGEEFVPLGVGGEADGAHLREYQKNGQRMRRELVRMSRADGKLKEEGNGQGNLQVFYEEGDAWSQAEAESGVRVVKLAKDRLDGEEILEAFNWVMKGEQVRVLFGGGKDEGGDPVFESDGDLKNYIEKGTKMREKLRKLMEQDNGTKLVSNREEALRGLLEGLG